MPFVKAKDGNDLDAYADDLGSLIEALDLRDAVLVGHSTGGGEVARYIGRHGTGRVAKAVLLSAIPPLMLKTDANPEGLPLEVFDGIRDGVAKDRSQFYRDLSGTYRQGRRVHGLSGCAARAVDGPRVRGPVQRGPAGVRPLLRVWLGDCYGADARRPPPLWEAWVDKSFDSGAPVDPAVDIARQSEPTLSIACALGAPSVITLTGEADLDSVGALQAAIDGALAHDPHLVLDLAGVTFADSTFLNTLVRARLAALEHEGSVRLQAPSSSVHHLLDLTGALQLFQVIPAEQLERS